MAYTIPTAASFKARHPRFAALGDATVDLYLAEASRSVSTVWVETDYADGIMYLAAHLMVAEGALAPTKVAPGVGNQIKRTKAGDVEIEYHEGTDPSSGGIVTGVYTSTIYGRRYLELAARNGGAASAAVAVV